MKMKLTALQQKYFHFIYSFCLSIPSAHSPLLFLHYEYIFWIFFHFIRLFLNTHWHSPGPIKPRIAINISNDWINLYLCCVFEHSQLNRFIVFNWVSTQRYELYDWFNSILKSYKLLQFLSIILSNIIGRINFVNFLWYLKITRIFSNRRRWCFLSNLWSVVIVR